VAWLIEGLRRHPELAIFLTLAAGFVIGRIRIGTFRLGNVIGTLIAGIRSNAKAARYTSLALLIVTIFKVFLHDLWRLGGLFRVGSFIGLAVGLMLVSFLYQRFLSKENNSHAH